MVTLCLMILLTVIAVGLLGLSTIALRTASQAEAMATARANARLALMLALGELQKTAGPDKAITATSEILTDSPAKPNTTGVWESWDFKPDGGALDYNSEKTQKFRCWLVSNSDPAAVKSQNFGTANWSGDTIELVGDASLGGKSPTSAKVVAGKVRVSRDGKVGGAYAWHVADEAVKARINTYRDPSQNQTLWQKRALLAGHRPDPAVVKAADATSLSFLPTDALPADYRKAREYSGKLTSLNQCDLLYMKKQMAKFRNHVTLYSTGLPTNVREGGLKQDLSSVFGMSATALPPEYNTLKLYESTHKITGDSDPYWSTLKGYYDIYKEPGLSASPPVYYKAAAEPVAMTQLTPPKIYYPAPVLAKVEILFSFVVRDSHGPWHGVGPYMGHMLYAPIITLHNPYNVSLKFDKLDVDIKGIPMAFNFHANGKSQNIDGNGAPVLMSLDRLYVGHNLSSTKIFRLSVSNWSDFATSTPSPITMNPGQTLVCGPYINSDAIFGGAGGEGQEVFFDWWNGLTGKQDESSPRAKCKPGFMGNQVSYDVDWITPQDSDSLTSDASGKTGVFGLKDGDQFYIEYKVQQNTDNSTDRMTVNTWLTVNGDTKEIGGLEFDYDAAALAKNFPATYRYPAINSSPNYLEPRSLYDSIYIPVKDCIHTQSFALFSVYARTVNGGVYDNGTRDKINNGQNLQHDGRLAGQPFLHHNPARTPTVVDMKTDPPGRFSHEMNLQPLLGNVADILNLDTTNRGYALTSNKVTRGIKSGSYLELPTGPLQTIADFRRSNALTSALLPCFVQPVANSCASPLMSTASVKQTGIAKYAMLDHSLLANHALYDRFYFSTFAPYGTKSVENVFTDFMAGTQPLISQAFEPYQPAGKTLTQAKSELFSGGKATATAYKTAAEYQMIRGAFNVNSTDVQAWKAVLASMSHNMIQTLWAKSGVLSEKMSALIPIMPMSLVNGGAIGSAVNAANIDDTKTNNWNGYRELTPEQLDELAQKIVEEVRKRGPFLSMSEFVNRRIGSNSELTRKGALQAAIDNSTVNNTLLAGCVTDVRLQDVSDQNLYRFATPEAATGNPAAGAPGWISQGDLLRILEPAATVRADTFVIRVCGEAHGADGRVTARAYAEAVVQRIPEYVDPVDRPSVNAYTASAAAKANKTFGRRLILVSFRWLAASEV